MLTSPRVTNLYYRCNLGSCHFENADVSTTDVHVPGLDTFFLLRSPHWDSMVYPVGHLLLLTQKRPFLAPVRGQSMIKSCWRVLQCTQRSQHRKCNGGIFSPGGSAGGEELDAAVFNIVLTLGELLLNSGVQRLVLVAGVNSLYRTVEGNFTVSSVCTLGFSVTHWPAWEIGINGACIPLQGR